MKNYPNLTLRTVRAMVRGIHFFKTRREDTYKILAKFLGNDPEALEESWHYGADMPPNLSLSRSAVPGRDQSSGRRRSEICQSQAGRLHRVGPLAELDRNGSIDRLYGGRDTNEVATRLSDPP